MARDYAALIRSLLATAEHPNTPEAEANLARERAEFLMAEYRVAEEEALAVDPALVVPTTLTVAIAVYGYDIAYEYVRMVEVIAKHAQVRTKVDWTYASEGRTMMVTAVGYDGDLRFFELLWTNAHLMFSTKIDPRWDSNLSVEENVYRMRQAGHKRKEIAQAAGWDGDKASDRSKVQRIYLREATKRGEDALAKGLDFNSRDYRAAYADSFVTHLHRRLRIARDAAESKGGLPEHKGRRDRVNEAFYAKFPAMRPSTETTVYVDPRNGCERCAKAVSGYCREHAYLKPRAWTRADELAHQRRTHGAAAQAGRGAGRSAAESVVVTRGHTTETRIGRAHGALEG